MGVLLVFTVVVEEAVEEHWNIALVTSRLSTPGVFRISPGYFALHPGVYRRQIFMLPLTTGEYDVGLFPHDRLRTDTSTT